MNRKQVNEALRNLKAASQGLDRPKKDKLVIVFENTGINVEGIQKDNLEDALGKLRNIAYDGNVPPVENLVVEAPGDPDDPNAAPPADPNAAGGAPGADPAAGGMDPSMGGDPAAMGGDPGMDGGDMGGGDMGAGAPGGDGGAGGAGGDPNGGGDGAAPQDPSQNAAGQEPPQDDKFNVGVTTPYDKNQDAVKLTDEEQEQLFTKINLLANIPDLVNFGKYLYNLTPENVDLDDIHYVNTLYDLSVKMGLITDEFENNNLLSKYDSYSYSVLSKSPEKDLQNAAGDQGAANSGQAAVVTERKKTVKTKHGTSVDVIDAPGLIIAKDIKDYEKQKKEIEEEDEIEDTVDNFYNKIPGARGLGWIVTFTAMLNGFPTIKTIYIKKHGKGSAEEQINDYLTRLGFKDINVITQEKVDPIDFLLTNYSGMRTLEDQYMQKFLDEKLAVNESVEIGVPPDMDADIEKTIELLNQEIMENPEIDFLEDAGVQKLAINKKDLDNCLVKKVCEDGTEGDCCTFRINKGDGLLSKMFCGSNCRTLCKCLENMAATCNLSLEAVGDGDSVELTFSR